MRLSRFIFLSIFLAGCLGSAHRGIPLADGKAERPSGEFSMPLAGAKVLSKFGNRGRRYHTGIDLRARRGGGDNVLAARAGKVIQAKTWRGYGRMITLKHSDGFTTRYAHLRKFLVKEGMTVKNGEPIGIVGDSGRASTAHLHFEILTPTGRFMDPGPFIPKNRK